MARLKQIVVDCSLPSALARFWAEALDGFEVRAYDDEEIARLAALGFTPETDPGVIVDGPAIEICFQKIDPARPPGLRKVPVHLDIVASDRSAEVEWLCRLGGEVVEVFDGNTWMRDPEGNDFCITD